MTMLKEKPEMTQVTEATTQRILVVDDENSISELIATSLRFVGFDVRTAANGAQALSMAEEFKPHAMVLDVMLPDLDGFEVCKMIRNEGVDTGVLFLTAKDGMEVKVKGLTLGSDYADSQETPSSVGKSASYDNAEREARNDPSN